VINYRLYFRVETARASRGKGPKTYNTWFVELHPPPHLRLQTLPQAQGSWLGYMVISRGNFLCRITAEIELVRRGRSRDPLKWRSVACSKTYPAPGWRYSQRARSPGPSPSLTPWMPDLRLASGRALARAGWLADKKMNVVQYLISVLATTLQHHFY
jgi:hypothetical protein